MTESTEAWKRDFILICLATFFNFGSNYFLLPILPQYLASIGGTPGQVGLVMGFFTLVAVLVRPLIGRMIDRIGRKPFILIGGGLYIIFPLVYNQLHSVAPFYLFRSFQGIAHALFIVSSMVYVADLAPRERRGELIGIFGTASVFAMAVIPALSNYYFEKTGDFNDLFTCAAALALAGFIAMCFLAEIKPQKSTGHKTTSLLRVGLRREILVPSLTLFSGTVSYGLIMTFLPLFAPERGIKNFGVFFTVYAVSTILSRIVTGRLSDRAGRRVVIIPSLALLGASAFLFPFLNGVGLLAVIAALFGLGFGSLSPSLNALVVDYTRPWERGAAIGFYSCFMDLGVSAGSIILGQAGELWGFPVMYNMGGAIILLGLLGFVFFLPRRSTRMQQE